MCAKRPNRTDIRESSRRMSGKDIIKGGIDYLRKFEETMENLLGKELKDLGSYIEKTTAEYTEEEKDVFIDGWVGDIQYLSKDFPNSFRYSFLIASCSWLETSLTGKCKLFKKKSNSRITLGDLKGGGIERCRTYFKKVVEFEFPDNHNAWAEILHYKNIRNVIVHHGGVLDSKNDKHKKVREYIDKNLTLSLKNNRKIILSGEFNRQVISTLESFWKEFCKSWEKWDKNT